MITCSMINSRLTLGPFDRQVIPGSSGVRFLEILQLASLPGPAPTPDYADVPGEIPSGLSARNDFPDD